MNYGMASTLAWCCFSFYAPWNQNRPLKSSCAAPATRTVLSPRWCCRNAKHYSVSLQNKVAAKNRWRNLQHKRHLHSRIIWRETDLMVGCIPLPYIQDKRLPDGKGKKRTHWLVRSLMTLQSRGKIVSFMRLRNTQKIFNRNSCQGIN